ncbi:MAG: hypothetical protein HQK49_10525 [Oligoflexia bacterium]|nr:hypothetical protein [Oligoflexia bacterium]
MKLTLIILGLIFCLNFNLIKASVASDQSTKTNAFDPKEDCSTIEKTLDTAKNAAIISCKWISEIGAGSKNETGSAFNKIAFARFCGSNYVGISAYIKDLTAESHKKFQYVLLHPTKPGIEKDMGLVHKEFFLGYKVFEQNNFAASLNNGNGCWYPYYWTKPGEMEASPKITFVIRCKDKKTGVEMVAASGVHVTHDYIDRLNPPKQCEGVASKSPYEKHN